MVIWLEDLLDDDEGAGLDPVHDAEEFADHRAAGEDDAAVPDEDRVVDVTDDVHDPVLVAAAIADDDGWALLDIEAARFTRH